MDRYFIQEREGVRVTKAVNAIIRFSISVPILLILIALLIIGSIATPDFLTLSNLLNILLQSSIYGVMAIGMTFLMINGYFDLSVGSTMGLSALLAIGLQPHGMFFAILASIAIGLLIGAINGLFVEIVKINAFVVTLALFVGVRGISFIYSQEKSIVGTISEFADFGMSHFLGVPTLAMIMLFFFILAEFILRMTSHGRNTYAVGGNYEVARNAGIRVRRIGFINFVISGLGAAIGGVFIASRMNAATPGLGWPDTNLMVIAIVALGGTKLRGGYGSMIYTLGGLLTFIMIRNIMDLLNVPAYFNRLFMGIILILVVLIDAKIKPLRS